MTEEEILQNRIRIGRRIAQLREERKISQAELAERTGLAQSNIARTEAGKFSTTLDVLTKVGEALGVKIDFV